MSSGYDLLKGLKVTFRELFRKSVTDKYPKEFREKPQRFHGRHVLNKYEDGMEKWAEINRKYSEIWPVITEKKDPPDDAKKWENIKDKFQNHFSEKPGS